ncbi:hypothetical protein ACIA8C_32565 [Nocardia sp. NPDC051321]|uniref:hypothetical protein n=1 Tax=Nocardia sp. NPDC051321 TaxID=3364323 RepID=UPI0037BDE83E
MVRTILIRTIVLHAYRCSPYLATPLPRRLLSSSRTLGDLTHDIADLCWRTMIGCVPADSLARNRMKVHRPNIAWSTTVSDTRPVGTRRWSAGNAAMAVVTRSISSLSNRSSSADEIAGGLRNWRIDNRRSASKLRKVTKVDLNGLQALLAAHAGEPMSGWLYRYTAKKALDGVGRLVTDADPEIRRRTWEVLDSLVGEGDRDDFHAALIDRLAEAQVRMLLTDVDPCVRTRVRRVNTWSTEERPLIRVALELFADERFDYAWPECIAVLHWPADLEIVIAALADATEEGLRARLLVAVGLPATTPLWPQISPVQSSSPIDCSRGCGGVVAAHRCRHLPVFLALVNSSREPVRDEAMSALYGFGPGTLDLLRSLRRSSLPGRRAALVMLAEFGWHHLRTEDQVTLRRLIGMKQRDETPEPLLFDTLRGAWYALATTDQAAVLDSFDLIDPVPATMRMGFAPWQGTEPRYIPAYQSPHYPEVFVSPALDGWTLIFCRNEVLGGAIPGKTSAHDRYEMYARLTQLSRRFGTAHWYEQFPDDIYPDCDDSAYVYGETPDEIIEEPVEDPTPTAWSQWCVARDGEIRMHCVSADDVYVYRCEEESPVDSLDELNAWIEANDHRADPCPEHEELRAQGFAAMLHERNGDDRLPPEDQEPAELDELAPPVDPTQDLVFGAQPAAQRLSIDLESLGPHTTVQGTGILAIPRSLGHRLRRGALPI